MNIQATISAIVVNVKRFVALNSCGYRGCLYKYAKRTANKKKWIKNNEYSR